MKATVSCARQEIISLRNEMGRVRSQGESKEREHGEGESSRTTNATTGSAFVDGQQSLPDPVAI